MNYLDAVNGKSVLVTGGTGSFGKRFITTILPYVKRIAVYSRDELKQYELSVFLQNEYPDNKDKVRFFIGDVKDEERLKMACNGIDIVIHAAALKHVPVCEYNPFEAVKTNIIGTQNVIKASIYNKVKKSILLSTDKAVSPINLYGATKMSAEKLFIQSNVYRPKKTMFSCVRYGNVVGSRGSIIPILLKQKLNGVVTITDKEMTRFWITLDQSVELVLHGLSNMDGGEIFIPKLKASHIMDLVDVIAPECKVEFIGKRPGEKVHEALITDEEAERAVDGAYCYKVVPRNPMWDVDRWNDLDCVKNLNYTSEVVERMSREDLVKFVEDFKAKEKNDN